jgi:hypothetical protein
MRQNLIYGMPILTVSTKQPSMPGPGIVTEAFNIINHTRANRVQVDIPDQLKKVILLIAQYGRKAILKHIPAASIAAIVGAGKPTQNGGHQFREWSGSYPDEEVVVV